MVGFIAKRGWTAMLQQRCPVLPPPEWRLQNFQ
jgi:hypothetical protein